MVTSDSAQHLLRGHAQERVLQTIRQAGRQGSREGAAHGRRSAHLVQAQAHAVAGPVEARGRQRLVANVARDGLRAQGHRGKSAHQPARAQQARASTPQRSQGVEQPKAGGQGQRQQGQGRCRRGPRRGARGNAKQGQGRCSRRPRRSSPSCPCRTAAPPPQTARRLRGRAPCRRRGRRSLQSGGSRERLFSAARPAAPVPNRPLHGREGPSRRKQPS